MSLKLYLILACKHFVQIRCNFAYIPYLSETQKTTFNSKMKHNGPAHEILVLIAFAQKPPLNVNTEASSDTRPKKKYLCCGQPDPT